MKKLIYRFCTANFIVTVEALPEYNFDFEYWEEKDIKSTKAKLKRGTLQLFCVKASVFHIKRNQELSSDYLGGCLYKNVSDFRDNLGIAQTKYGSYFHDMIKTVISEAKDNLKCH